MTTRVPKPKTRGLRLTPRLLHQNAIVHGLEDSLIQRIVKYSTLVNLALRQKIYVPEKPISEVYFPIDCVLSVVTTMKDGNQIEVGTIGREGMSALPCC